MITPNNPFELTPEQREAFGEYVLRQREKGRDSLPMDELDTVIEMVRICLPASNLQK